MTHCDGDDRANLPHSRHLCGFHLGRFGRQDTVDTVLTPRQDVESTVFYHEFGEIMMRAPVIGLEFTRYLPLALVPFVLLQARSTLCPKSWLNTY